MNSEPVNQSLLMPRKRGRWQWLFFFLVFLAGLLLILFAVAPNLIDSLEYQGQVEGVVQSESHRATDQTGVRLKKKSIFIRLQSGRVFMGETFGAIAGDTVSVAVYRRKFSQREVYRTVQDRDELGSD